jgi:hypothetical protein
MFRPMKKAVQLNKIKETKPYILVQIEESTGFQYAMISMDNDKDAPLESIHVIGNYPPTHKLSDELYRSLYESNIFVFYGEFSDLSYESYDLPPNVPARVFIAEDWDIVYPIYRSGRGLGLYGKWFLTQLDFWD